MITVTGCSKTYHARGNQGALPVLKGVTLSVAAGEFVSVLGPSGCGKTTLLRIIAGLIPCDEGEVRIGGRLVSGPQSDCAMVFQHHALLPWCDVEANVAFGLAMRSVPRKERGERARELITRVGLAGFEHRYPQELSGGMQQRAGLARALAVNPSILLMDEPFGSVDSLTRRLLQEDLLRLHHEERKTVLFVTHSVDEATRLGDRVVVLGPRPARVEEVVDTGLGRPRSPGLGKEPRFVELKEYLWSRMKAVAVNGDRKGSAT
jgi:NitT/TauT family transport system ATP-binding protein